MKRRLILILLLLVGGAIVNIAVAWGCALWSMDQVAYWGASHANLRFETPPLLVQPQEPWMLVKDARSAGLRLHVYERVDLVESLRDFAHYALIGHAQLAAFFGDIVTMYARDEDIHEFVADRDRNKRLQQAFERAETLQELQAVTRPVKVRVEAVRPIASMDVREKPTGMAAGFDTLIVVDAGWPSRVLRGADAASRTWPPVHVRMINATRIPILGLGSTEPATQPRLIPFGPIWPGFAINTLFYAVILWARFAFPFALRRRRRIKRGLCPACGYDLRGSMNASACPECGTAISLSFAQARERARVREPNA